MTQTARITPDGDDSSTLSPHSHTQNRPPAVPSSSTFDFSPPSDSKFAFNTPPTAASFSFSPHSTSSFPFVFTPSSSRDSHSTSARVTDSPETPSRSGRCIFTPPSRATTTSTTRALFSAFDLGSSSPEVPGGLSPPDHRQFQSSNLSPHANVSTYRDLYNATPSPQPGPSSRPNQTNAPNIDSPSPSSLLTSGVHNLIIQSIEPSAAEGEGYDDAGLSSDYDSEDGSVDDATYNVRDEELPDAPIYNSQLQNLLRDVRSNLLGLVRSMHASQMVHDDNTHVSDLYRQAETESKFEYPQTRIVGFIGDSGVGKSSLINSLLDCGGLARSSGSGEACTSVVTEFRQVDEAHPHPYTIEADFMTTDEMNELLRELLMAYRIRHTRAFDEDLAEGEADRITRLSERSWTTLQSLFPNEGDLTETFLSNEELDAEDRILARLREWAMTGLNNRPGGPDALHYTIRARDIRHCRENIDILTVASREPQRPALWPFVKLIRVYIRSSILRTGLVVADMPGFRDMNYARVRATEKYLRNTCDEVFIVSEINRCRSDPSIEEIWHKCIRNQPMRIVCTKSETELDGEEIIRDPKMPARVITETRRLLDRIEQARRSLRRLGRRRRDSSGAQQAQYALREAQQNDELGRLELERKTLLINARNEISRTHLSRKYQANVKVFCVSKELYENYRGGEREQATEYIRLSGIPELRQYCQLVPADAQFRETDTFLRIRVPALLGSLNQWVLAGSNDVTADRAETLRRVLDEAQRTLHSCLISRGSCIRSVKTELESMFERSITRYIRGLQVQRRWKDGAIRASQNWSSMHHSSYAAFCRKYGVHQIGKENVRYWNNEVLQDASEELHQCWSTLMEWLDGQQNTTEDQIYAIFSVVSTSIEAYTRLSPASIENLLDNLDTQRRGIAYTTQRALEHILLQTRRVTRDVLDGHSSSSYIAEIMRPAYHYCNMESGTGSDRRRKDHMEEYVRNQDIFQQLSTRAKMDYDAVINAAFADLQRKLNEEVRNITRDLGVVIAVEGEIPEARRELELAQRVRDGVSQLQAQVNEAHLILNRLQGGVTRSA